MKKIFLLAVVAIVAFVACSKDKGPEEPEPQEIFFRPTIGKTIEEDFAGEPSFAWNKRFYSYAYKFVPGEKWEEDASTSTTVQPYITNARVAYNNGLWQASETYCWPEDEYASLTFFAWADNTENPEVRGNAVVSCAVDEGIKITGYNIVENKNKDLMVDGVANLRGVDGVYYKGVEVVFSHILAQVMFTARLDPEADFGDTEITLKKITLKGLHTTGNFSQYGKHSEKIPSGWSGWTGSEDFVVFDGSTKLTAEAQYTPDLTSNRDDYYIILHQGLEDSKKIEVVYEKKSGAETETVTVTETLQRAYAIFNIYSRCYLLNITIGQSGVGYSCDIQDWVDFGSTPQ